MLQHAGNEADLVGRIHGQKGRPRAAEVVKTHGFSELLADARADDVVDAAVATEVGPCMTPRGRHARCDQAGGGGSPSNSA